MASRNTYEEVIRLLVQASGDEQIRALVAEFDDLGDTADLQANIARRALERMGDAAEAIGKVDTFDKLKRDLIDTERQLKQAQDGAQALFREFGQDTSSRRVSALQAQARKAVTDLTDAAQRQRTQLQGLRSELAAAGVDTRQLGSAQGMLRAQMSQARGVLAEAAGNVRRFRAEATQAAQDVPAANREVARSYTLVERSVSRLRGVIAAAGAYLGLDAAVSGVKNLLDTAAAAETTRRAFQNLYKDQAAGNRAFDGIKGLARESGLSFQFLADEAKKLKAFGLEPLDGALQAIVDQNAAVGGSQEELSGKVLALGQAWAKQKLQGEEILQLQERGVPVWDLLAKVTGKSTAELQKLSEQGKLGRDVIRQLYEEIGRANAGAASAGMSSISGLMAQMTARWDEFKQKVVDAGLGTYFKEQLQSLLGSTRGLDGLASRVSTTIINAINGVKSLGQTLAPVATFIGGVTSALARNAEAVIFLGKVYVALKLTQVANGLLAVANGAKAATAATAALSAAEATRATGVGRLGGLLAALPRAATVTLAVVGAEVAIHGVTQLTKGIEAYQQAQRNRERFDITQRQFQQEQLRLGQQLQQLYASSSGVAIKSASELGGATRAQAQDYRAALESARQFFGGVIREARASGNAQREAAATERWRALGDAIKQAEGRIAELGRAAAREQGVRALVDSAVGKFDQLISKGKEAREAISGAFNGVDFGTGKGAQQALSILEQVSVRGREAAQAVRDELREALKGVSDHDLPALQQSAAKAFGANSAAARDFAREVDRINLNKLGVDVEAIETGFTRAGRAAVDQFRGAVGEIDKLGLTAQQRSTAIAQAFDNAFRQASTKSELEALRKALQDALSSGDIGFQEFQARIAETDAKLKGLAGTAASVGEGAKDGAGALAGSLSSVGQAAAAAADDTKKVDDATSGAAESMQMGDKAGQAYALTMYAVSDAATAAYSAANRLQTGLDGGARLFADEVNRITGEVKRQGDAVQDQIRKIDQELEEFDSRAARRAQLRQQYGYLDASVIEPLIAKEEELARAQEQRAEAQRRAAEAASQTTRTATSTDPVAPAAIARRAAQDVAAAADSVNTMLARASEAATAMDSASTRLAGAGGQMVVRIVVEGGGLDRDNSGRLKLQARDVDQLAHLIVRRIAEIGRNSNRGLR